MKDCDDFCFHDVGNRIPHLRNLYDLTTEELGWFLINAIQIVLGARPSTRSHIIVGEDLLQLFQDSMESGARLVSQFIAVGVSMTGR